MLFFIIQHPGLILGIWLVLLFSLSITAFGSYYIQLNYFLNSVHKGKPIGIALTFDDGPDPEITPAILEILKEYQVKATFFIIGKKAEQYPELLKSMERDGHTLANHSYSHSNWIGFFSGQKLAADINRCSGVIKNLTGKTPLFLRPPFGVTNPKYAAVLKELGLNSIGWTIRSFDTTISNRNRLINRITRRLKSGSILLLHDNQKITLNALPDVLKYCKTIDLNIVNLTELIEKEPYAGN